MVVQPGLCWTWSETPKTDFFHDVAHIGIYCTFYGCTAESKIFFLIFAQKLNIHDVDCGYEFIMTISTSTHCLSFKAEQRKTKYLEAL